MDFAAPAACADGFAGCTGADGFAAAGAPAAGFATLAAAVAGFAAFARRMDFHHPPAPEPPALFVASFVPALAFATRSLRLGRFGSTDLDLV
jgi:hypothetical protein